MIVDSISQVHERGESYHAMKNGLITKDDLIEIGEMITKKELQRTSDDEVTVADLTGVAVQDIQISKAVWSAILPKMS